MSETLLSRRPAVRLVASLVLGILLGNSFPVRSSWAIIALIVTLATVGFLCHANSLKSFQNLLFHILVVLAGLSLRLLSAESASELRLDPIKSEPAYIAGRVEGEPVKQPKKVTFVVRTELVRKGTTQDHRSRRILVTLRKPGQEKQVTELECGSMIKARCTMEPFPLQRNPGEFDYGRYLTLNNVMGVATIAAPEDLQANKASTFSGFNSFIGVLQRTLYRAIDEYHSPEQASFLKGVILGYRADLSDEIKQSFMNTGTIHILAVSGSNVAVIVLILYVVFGFARLPKRLCGAATIVGIILFTFITGASPSVVRAGIMATALLLGSMVQRKADVYNSVSVAALVILVADPNALFDVGFQLSFVAVLSIVYIYPILEKVIERIPERYEEIKAIDYVLKLFAVSLAAQIGTLPFTAYYFGRVSIVSLVANLIVVPLSGLNVLLGVATVATSFVVPFLASCYASLNKLMIDILLGFVKAAASVPYAYVEIVRVELMHGLMFYAACAVILHLGNARVVKWGIMAVLGCAGMYLVGDVVRHQAAGLKVTVLDVGQGDAILVETPGDKAILIDAGPKQFGYDAGERTIVPFLRRNGTDNLDAFVLTHSHGDHIGGAPFLLKHVPVRNFIETNEGGSSSLYRATKEAIHSRSIANQVVGHGMRIDIDAAVRIYVLHPALSVSGRRSLNNTSLVVKLVYGHCSMLLVGDAETEAETDILVRYREFLDSDILKVGHHGSRTSSSPPFLHYVNPKAAVISVGVRNKFGHPAQSTVVRLGRLCTQVHRTDRQSAAVYQCDGSVWWQDDWRTNTRMETVMYGDGLNGERTASSRMLYNKQSE